MEFYRQGDVGILRVKALPRTAIKQKCKDRIVLALGEVTGHAHAIASDEAELFIEGTRRFLEVCLKADLVHEEHGTITLDRGIYEVIQQREYFPEAVRNVHD
jgi:hypothetical protein